MVSHVVGAAGQLGAGKIAVVVAPGMDNVRQQVVPHHCAIQQTQSGTGNAVLAAHDYLKEASGDILILYGDVPLITPETLQAMRDARGDAALVVLGFSADDPMGYGRMVTHGDTLERIVEHKDASDDEKQISLCNSGIILADAQKLWRWLAQVTADNAQQEYYLTDIVKIARADNEICKYVITDEDEVRGVNSRAQLAALEAIFQARQREAAMANGATLIDPDSIYFAADIVLGRDVIVHPQVVFGTKVTVGDNAEIFSFSHIEGATIGAGAKVGPFARLRPGAQLADNVRVGNFVEIKNAMIGHDAKINHLTYIGDASIGARSNVGAGTITCNYDGFNKHQTEIGADVFVGSNSILVAPVKIGDNALIAAGSVITEDVAKNALAVARARQAVKPDWAKKFKDKKGK